MLIYIKKIVLLYPNLLLSNGLFANFQQRPLQICVGLLQIELLNNCCRMPNLQKPHLENTHFKSTSQKFQSQERKHIGMNFYAHLGAKYLIAVE